MFCFIFRLCHSILVTELMAGLCIHYTPVHPVEHKITVCRYLINRINTLLIRDFNNNNNNNKTIIIAKNNDFPTQII